MNSRLGPIQRRPRVLIVGTHLSQQGGHRTPSEDLRDRLVQTGEFDVISCSDRRYAAARLVHTLITISRNWGRVDVVIVDVFSGRAFLLAEFACAWSRRSGARTILTLHGGGLPKFARQTPKRVRRLLRSADHVTSPSAYLADRFAEVCSVEVIPNPIDLARFGRRASDPAPARGPGGRTQLLWVRAFHAIYRPWAAVKILHRVTQTNRHVELTLVGADKKDGSLERVRATADELGVADKVRVILGLPHEQIADELQRADVFLNTTSIDNTPMSVLEALAMGVPVVSTSVGGIPYLVQHGQSALLSPLTDDEAMARNVLRLLDDPDCVERLRKGGFAVAAAHDWSQVMPRWQVLIRQATKGRSS